MDNSAKTLAQLSAEKDEKKYITLDSASKISGYTKDYIDRLCRLDKIEFRERNNGDKVVELSALLRETHTILMSFEGINYVELNELLAPVARVAAPIVAVKEPAGVPAPMPWCAQPVPQFGLRACRQPR